MEKQVKPEKQAKSKSKSKDYNLAASALGGPESVTQARNK